MSLSLTEHPTPHCGPDIVRTPDPEPSCRLCGWYRWEHDVRPEHCIGFVA